MSGPDDVDRPAPGRSALPARLADASRTLSARLRNADNPLLARLGRADRVAVSVGGLVVLALVLRLVFLGARTAHFDEGRVGYWILHFVDTGEFHYRYIIHGPFVQHVNAALFQAVGANDFTMRLVVALIGAFLPLAALLLREHLDDPEVVAVAFFLAMDPAMLYYSRFFRSTVPVAAFAFVAFGLLVRFSDTRRFRYLHGAVVFVALAFTAKENAAIYLLVWLGAAALLVDHTLFRPGNEESGLDRLRAWWARNSDGRDWRAIGPRYAGHALLAATLFFVVTFYFYAPRAGGPEDVGLWRSIGSGDVGPLLAETWRTVAEGYGYWFGGGIESGEGYATLGDRFVAYFGMFADTLLTAAGPLFAFAIVGFLVERYASRRRRYLVMFASYWGFVSVIGYPLGADIIGAAWTVVNVIVPLSIPAAVGVAMVYRWGREARADGDTLGSALVGVVLLLVVFQVAATGLTSAFVTHSSAENSLVQYAQPGDDLKPTMDDIGALAAANEGTDVLFYGDQLTEQSSAGIEPTCTDIGETLPLQWYLRLHDASADCATSGPQLEEALADDPPPVVIVATDEEGPIEDRLPDYERRVRLLRTFGENVSFYLDTGQAGNGSDDGDGRRFGSIDDPAVHESPLDRDAPVDAER